MTWLSPLNFPTTQNDVFSRRQPDTGQWILENDLFKEWLDNVGKPLWCPGIRMSYFQVDLIITKCANGTKLALEKQFLRTTNSLS